MCVCEVRHWGKIAWQFDSPIIIGRLTIIIIVLYINRRLSLISSWLSTKTFAIVISLTIVDTRYYRLSAQPYLAVFLFDIRDCIKEWLVLCFYSPSLSPSLLTWLWAIEYVCCFVLLYFGCYVMCGKNKKNVDNKKKIATYQVYLVCSCF